MRSPYTGGNRWWDGGYGQMGCTAEAWLPDYIGMRYFKFGLSHHTIISQNNKINGKLMIRSYPLLSLSDNSLQLWSHPNVFASVTGSVAWEPWCMSHHPLLGTSMWRTSIETRGSWGGELWSLERLSFVSAWKTLQSTSFAMYYTNRFGMCHQFPTLTDTSPLHDRTTEVPLGILG